MLGRGPSQIAVQLEKERVLNPTAYKRREGRKTPHQTPENECRWHESTVVAILERMEYIGATVNFKTYSNSIGDKKQRENPIENQKVSMERTLPSSRRKSMIRCRKSDSNGIAERQQAKAVSSQAWCSVPTASRSSITPPPAILKSGRTFFLLYPSRQQG